MTTDEELMERVRVGDERALAELMRRWEIPVKRVLARILLNAAEADELAHEAFVRLWQARERFRAGAAFRPWVFSIAMNLARNRLRWWRKRPHESLEGWEERLESGETGRAPLERAERALAVRRAVSELPRDQKEAVVLFEFEHLSHAEIAAATGATPKAVETRLYRARAALRVALAGHISRPA